MVWYGLGIGMGGGGGYMDELLAVRLGTCDCICGATFFYYYYSFDAPPCNNDLNV